MRFIWNHNRFDSELRTRDTVMDQWYLGIQVIWIN